MALFARRENPPAKSNYRDYKPFLRKDFLVRCAYCERTEDYLGGEEAFEVEHLKPKSKFPDLICSYDNLYYVCRGMQRTQVGNLAVGDSARGQRFADPCMEDPYVHHLRELEDGGVQELTECGIYSSGHIRLGRDALRKWRRLRTEARQDLPKLAAVARFLEQIVSSCDPPDRDDAAGRLSAVRRRIEESKLRFSIE